MLGKIIKVNTLDHYIFAKKHMKQSFLVYRVVNISIIRPNYTCSLRICPLMMSLWHGDLLWGSIHSLQLLLTLIAAFWGDSICPLPVKGGQIYTPDSKLWFKITKSPFLSGPIDN